MKTDSPSDTGRVFEVRRSALLPLLLFLLLAIAWTWPLATRLSSRIAHDPGDPVLNTWILWWNSQALPFSERWWSPPIFYPMTGALALSEHLAGIAVFTAPLQRAGASPVALYNAALIASCWLSALFAYLLGRRVTGSLFGGVVAGLAFGLAPYRAGQLAHLQVLTAQWMPLTLFAMHAYLDDRRRRWLAVVALGWLLQALSNGYFLLFFPVLLGLWFLWFGTARPSASGPPKAGHHRAIATLALVLIASSVLLVPMLLHYWNVHVSLGLRRGAGEMVMFSATPASFVSAPPLLKFWPLLTSYSSEGLLFTGVTVILVVIVGAIIAIRRSGLASLISRRSPGLFYGAAALVMWWFAMGPGEDGAGMFVKPYTLLAQLPGFSELRVPARFAMLGTLCISIAAALGAVTLMRSLDRRRGLVGIVVVCGLLADGWLDAMPLVTPPPRVNLPDVSGGVVLELPTDELSVNVGAMFRSMAHRLPLVNGFSGHIPPHYRILTTSLLRGDHSPLTFLAQGRPLVVLVHRLLDRDGEIRALVERAGGTLYEESGVGPVMVIPPQPRDRLPVLGQPLTMLLTSYDPGGKAAADLEHVQTVRALAFATRWRHAEIPEQLTIETSVDGHTWTTVWENWTGGIVLAGALQDQHEVPFRIVLPDVNARYVRISPVPRWVVGEMAVYGPG